MKTPGAAVLDYLRVDAFLHDIVTARALAAAIRTGLLEQVAELDAMPIDGLAARFRLAPAGARLLLDLLVTGGVLEGRETIGLSSAFREAWKYRDLLETKLDFAAAVFADFAEDFEDLIADPGAFIRRSRTYDLFRYDQCLDESPVAVERARRWMRIVTGYTRYEGRVLAECLDFSAHQRALDVGGNSGELALALCRASPALEARVLDLPAVCRVGREHVAAFPEGKRVTFRAGSALEGELESDRDLITFKSMLHDWPEREAGAMLARAVEALVPGGRLVVFERAPFTFNGPPDYALIPCLLFLHCYRDPAWYVAELARLGLAEVERLDLALDSPWMVVTGRKA